MSITQFLEPERVLIDVETGSRKRALETLSGELARTLETVNATQVFNALIKRERLGCTSLERGVALPHATLTELTAPVAAYLRLAEPVNFDTDDGVPVDIIFGLLLPATERAECSGQLAHIADLLRDERLRRGLRAAQTAAETYALLVQAQTPPSGLKASG